MEVRALSTLIWVLARSEDPEAKVALREFAGVIPKLRLDGESLNALTGAKQDAREFLQQDVADALRFENKD